MDSWLMRTDGETGLPRCIQTPASSIGSRQDTVGETAGYTPPGSTELPDSRLQYRQQTGHCGETAGYTLPGSTELPDSASSTGSRQDTVGETAGYTLPGSTGYTPTGSTELGKTGHGRLHCAIDRTASTVDDIAWLGERNETLVDGYSELRRAWFAVQRDIQSLHPIIFRALLTDIVNVKGTGTNVMSPYCNRENKNECVFAKKNKRKKPFRFSRISLFSRNVMLETSRGLSTDGSQFLCFLVFPFPNWQMADFDRGVSWC